MGKELPKLAIELRCQRFIGCQDEGWPLHAGNNVSDGKRLTRPGHPQQRLMSKSGREAVHQSVYGSGLIARRLEGTDDLKLVNGLRHSKPLVRLERLKPYHRSI